MNAELLRPFFDESDAELSAPGTYAALKKLLLQETTFRDAFMKELAESVEKPTRRRAECEAAFKALETLHATFPGLPLSISAVGREYSEEQVDKAISAVFTAFALQDTRPPALLKASLRSNVALALFCAIHASRWAPEYLLNAAQILQSSSALKHRIAAEMCIIEYNVRFAREFGSRQAARAAASRASNLLRRVENVFSEANDLFGMTAAELARTKAAMEEIAGKCVVCRYEQRNVAFESFRELRDLIGAFEHRKRSLIAVQRESIVTDDNLLDIKRHLLTSKTFVAACFKAERANQRIDDAFKALQAPTDEAFDKPGTSYLPEIAEETPNYPERQYCAGIWQGFERVAKLCAEYPKTPYILAQLHNGALARELAAAFQQHLRLQHFYYETLKENTSAFVKERSAVVTKIHQYIAKAQREAAEEQGHGALAGLRATLMDAFKCAAEIKKSVLDIENELIELQSRTNMSLYIRKGELQYLIWDAKVNIYDVYDSDLEEIALKLEEHFVGSIDTADAELKICEGKIDVLKSKSKQFEFSFDEQQLHAAESAADRWHTVLRFLEYAQQETLADIEMARSAGFHDIVLRPLLSHGLVANYY